MNRKFKMTPRELILRSKDYSNLTKDELQAQYDIIMNQYDKFKYDLSTSLKSRNTNPQLLIVQERERLVHQDTYTNIIKEVDEHIRIMEDLLNKL